MDQLVPNLEREGVQLCFQGHHPECSVVVNEKKKENVFSLVHLAGVTHCFAAAAAAVYTYESINRFKSIHITHCIQ